MIYQLLGVLLVIAIDVIFEYGEIKRNIIPNHIVNSILRVLLVAGIMYNPNPTSWILHCVDLIPVYSFLFETSLNILRGERISYIGIPDQRSLWNIILSYKGQYSLINQIQLKTIGEGPSFWFKAILFIFCFTLALFNFNPYF